MMKKKEKIVIAGILFLVVLEVLKYGIATKVIVSGFLMYQLYKYFRYRQQYNDPQMFMEKSPLQDKSVINTIRFKILYILEFLNITN